MIFYVCMGIVTASAFTTILQKEPDWGRDEGIPEKLFAIMATFLFWPIPLGLALGDIYRSVACKKGDKE